MPWEYRVSFGVRAVRRFERRAVPLQLVLFLPRSPPAFRVRPWLSEESSHGSSNHDTCACSSESCPAANTKHPNWYIRVTTLNQKKTATGKKVAGIFLARVRGPFCPRVGNGDSHPYPVIPLWLLSYTDHDLRFEATRRSSGVRRSTI